MFTYLTAISTGLFVPREAVSFVFLTPLKVSLRRKKKRYLNLVMNLFTGHVCLFRVTGT